MSSRKIRVTIIALIVLLISAIIGYAAVDRSKTAEEAASQAEIDAMQLFRFDPDSIEEVIFDNDEGHFRITSDNGAWTLAETDYPHEIRLNPYYINACVNYMCDLLAVQKVDADPEKLASYGLDKPSTVTCTGAGKSYTLYVGSASVTQEYWYVSLPDDSHIYAVDYTEGETLRGGTAYLKSRSMLEGADVSIDGFCLKKGTETVVDLSKKSGLWEMLAPYKGANINSAQVSSMLTSLTRVEYTSFETILEKPEDAAAYGLDKPAYTLTVKTGDLTEELLFAPHPDGGMYVLSKGSGQVAVLNAQTSGFLDLSPAELLIRQLVELPYANARSLEAKVDDLSFTMEMDAQAGTCSLNGRDLSGMDANVQTLHKNLYDTVSNLTWEELLPDAELPEEAEPDCSFRFTAADGTVTELTLYQTADENVYLAAINGENSHLTVRRRSLTGTTGVLNFYEKITDAIS